MPTRRELVLDAAIELLGTKGSRGLTHRGVDELAGVPLGTTSNYFRTRDGLIDGVTTRLVERDESDWAAIAAVPAPTTVEQLVDALVAYALHSAGPDRTRSAARYALALEAVASDAVRASMLRARGELLEWAFGLLRGLPGATEDTVAIVMDYLDGVVLHQVTTPVQPFDPRPRLETLTISLLGR